MAQRSGNLSLLWTGKTVPSSFAGTRDPCKPDGTQRQLEIMRFAAIRAARSSRIISYHFNISPYEEPRTLEELAHPRAPMLPRGSR